MLILNPEVGGERQDDIVDRVRQLVVGSDGAVANLDDWGERRISFPMGGQATGRYMVMTCDAPVAVVSLVENRGGYIGIGRGGLPESPLPLVRVLMQQSGCFRIVDRNSGLEQTINEQELKDKGVLRSDEKGNVKKGRGIVAQYTVVPSLTFSE